MFRGSNKPQEQINDLLINVCTGKFDVCLIEHKKRAHSLLRHQLPLLPQTTACTQSDRDKNISLQMLEVPSHLETKHTQKTHILLISTATTPADKKTISEIGARATESEREKKKRPQTNKKKNRDENYEPSCPLRDNNTSQYLILSPYAPSFPPTIRRPLFTNASVLPTSLDHNPGNAVECPTTFSHINQVISIFHPQSSIPSPPILGPSA